MNTPDIALIGRARTGKDTIADYLVREHGYVRVAFADALKEMALSVDPIVDSTSGLYMDQRRLSNVVAAGGWERAKDSFPEVRRFLQNLGVAVRERDPEFWVRAARPGFLRLDKPVVVTDVRFMNEVDELEFNGFLTVSVTRPSLASTDTHISETELATYPTDRAIVNAGSIADLEADVRRLLLSA